MNNVSRVFIHQMELGPMQNYTYFVGDSLTKEVAVIDPGWEADSIIRQAESRGLKIVAVLLTHGHPDHVDALGDLIAAYNVPTYISSEEAGYFRPDVKELKNIEDGDKIKIGEVRIGCIHTPGHTPGGMCFLVEGNLFTGDTLFLDGCGRVDLPGGDADALMDSIQNRIMKLPDETVIYPGHRYHPLTSETIGNQKKTNPYMQ